MRNWRAVVFSLAWTAVIVGGGLLCGYLLGPWGALVSFPLGLSEGGLMAWWLIRKRRRVL